jgi:hypothetical protein
MRWKPWLCAVVLFGCSEAAACGGHKSDMWYATGHNVHGRINTPADVSAWRAWAATLTDECVRREYQGWIDFYDKQLVRRGEDEAQRERGRHLAERIPILPRRAR